MAQSHPGEVNKYPMSGMFVDVLQLRESPGPGLGGQPILPIFNVVYSTGMSPALMPT